jgi:hypothetical protein
LDEYQNELDKCKIPRPPPAIPFVEREWTEEETEMMRKNRKIAQTLYEHVKNHD